MSDTYVIGIDMTPFTRRSGKTAAQLGAKRHCWRLTIAA